MTWTEYQGVEVIESHAAPARHPRWGYARPTLLKGGILLLLADDTPLVVCNSCDYNGITGYAPYVKPEGDFKEIMRQSDSVLSHVNGKHHVNKADRRTSLYSDAQIKVAIRTFLKWKGSRMRNWTQSACDELDELGFKPLRGEKWTPGQLGSLARTYMRKAKFKNVKAAPMVVISAPVNDGDQSVLANMVREAAVREGSKGNDTGVAANVRIVEQRKPTRRGRPPINYDKIIEESKAARAARLEEEVAVPASNGSNPTLNFVGSTEPTPTKTLVVDQMSIPVASPALVATTPEPAKSDYQHVTELPTGEPMFTYKGDLMVGKSIKGVEI